MRRSKMYTGGPVGQALQTSCSGALPLITPVRGPWTRNEASAQRNAEKTHAIRITSNTLIQSLLYRCVSRAGSEWMRASHHVDAVYLTSAQAAASWQVLEDAGGEAHAGDGLARATSRTRRHRRRQHDQDAQHERAYVSYAD